MGVDSVAVAVSVVGPTLDFITSAVVSVACAAITVVISAGVGGTSAPVSVTSACICNDLS